MAILERIAQYEETTLTTLEQKDLVHVPPLHVQQRHVEPKGLTPLSQPDEQAWYSWWKKPEAQLERARELWPDIRDWPEPPKVFNTKDAVILLHVPEPIDALWARVDALDLTKFRSDIFDEPWDTADAAQYDDNQPQWVWYNFMHGRGEAPRTLRPKMDERLAGREVLSALSQFPAYAKALSNDLPSPMLSGMRLNYDGENSNVLYIRKDVSRKVLELCVQWDGTHSSGYVSPTVMPIA